MTVTPFCARTRSSEPHAEAADRVPDGLPADHPRVNMRVLEPAGHEEIRQRTEGGNDRRELRNLGTAPTAVCPHQQNRGGDERGEVDRRRRTRRRRPRGPVGDRGRTSMRQGLRARPSRVGMATVHDAHREQRMKTHEGEDGRIAAALPQQPQQRSDRGKRAVGTRSARGTRTDRSRGPSAAMITVNPSPSISGVRCQIGPTQRRIGSPSKCIGYDENGFWWWMVTMRPYIASSLHVARLIRRRRNREEQRDPDRGEQWLERKPLPVDPSATNSTHAPSACRRPTTRLGRGHRIHEEQEERDAHRRRDERGVHQCAAERLGSGQLDPALTQLALHSRPTGFPRERPFDAMRSGHARAVADPRARRGRAARAAMPRSTVTTSTRGLPAPSATSLGRSANSTRSAATPWAGATATMSTAGGAANSSSNSANPLWGRSRRSRRRCCRRRRTSPAAVAAAPRKPFVSCNRQRSPHNTTTGPRAARARRQPRDGDPARDSRSSRQSLQFLPERVHQRPQRFLRKIKNDPRRREKLRQRPGAAQRQAAR